MEDKMLTPDEMNALICRTLGIITTAQEAREIAQTHNRRYKEQLSETDIVVLKEIERDIKSLAEEGKFLYIYNNYNTVPLDKVIKELYSLGYKINFADDGSVLLIQW